MKKYLTTPFLLYLRFWARLQIKKIDPIIIGITGSAGKTSTRLLVSQILASKSTVKESFKANSETGIPLNILGLQVHTFSIFEWILIFFLAPFAYLFNWKKYDYYVVEMGIDSPFPPKNMEYLLSIIKPHIGVILNVANVHTENFDSLIQDRNPRRRSAKLTKEIAREKGKLVTSLNARDIAVINIDQKEIRDLQEDIKSRILTFGKGKNAMMRILSFKYQNNGTIIKLEYNHKVHELILENLIIESNYVHTVAATCGVAIAAGVSLEKSIKVLRSNHPIPAGRWTLLNGINNSTLIDSSYNASPLTMKAALENLKNIAGRKKKIAIVGDMRELGLETKQAHRDLATWIMSNSNEVYLFGSDTLTHTLPVLMNKKFPTKHYQSMENLTKELKKNLSKNSFVLIKGSQFTIFLERAVESLLKDKNDSKLLCRRGSYWNKLRAKTP